MREVFPLRRGHDHHRNSAAVVLAAVATLFLTACNSQQEDANNAHKVRNESEGLALYYLFGADETKSGKSARDAVAKFERSTIYLEQPSEFAASDFEAHAKLVKDIFEIAGLSVEECRSPSTQCSTSSQIVALSLRDDKKGTLNQTANYMAFTHGGLDLSADQTRPTNTSTPLLQRKLGVTCVAVISSNAAEGQLARHGLSASIINIAEGKDRLHCTAEKALYLLGLYSTPEMSQTAATIANAATEGRPISRDLVPSDMLSAIDFLYSNEVKNPLTEPEARRRLSETAK